MFKLSRYSIQITKISFSLFILLLSSISFRSNAQIVNNALDFDGVNDYVACPNGISSGLSAGKLTVEAWIFLHDYNSWSTIIKNWGNSTTGAFHFGLDANGQNLSIYITQSNGKTISVAAQTVFGLNAWHHVAFSADGSFLKLYLDGNKIGVTAIYDGTLTTTFPYTNIGVKPGENGGADNINPGWFNGKIDELRIWNVGRNQAEIRADMPGGTCGTTSGLIAYYYFNQGIASESNAGLTTAIDSTSNNNNGILTSFALIGNSGNWVEGTTGLNDSATYYFDGDGDTYGNPELSVFARVCAPPAGYVLENSDCNDANASIHPGAKEILNGVDDNCNGIIDDINITSDAAWLYSDNLENGWEQAVFDDSGWKPVIVLGTGGLGDPDVALIWGDHPASENTVVYMRKTFVLGNTVPEIALDHTEDDDANVYVNGTLVSSEQNFVTGPDIYNIPITQYLLPNSTNVIAVVATDIYCCNYNFCLKTHPVGNLPLQLISFTGEIQKTRSLLHWKTTNEINTAYFNIQRSYTGSNFSTIAKQNSNGNGVRQEYLYSDENVKTLNQPNIFYRLQMVDKNGSFTYSNIVLISVNSSNNEFAKLSPNPNNGNFALQMHFPEKAALTTLSLYNEMGLKIWQQNAGKLSGSITRNIALENKLPAGMYILKIQFGDTMQMKKILVTK